MVTGSDVTVDEGSDVLGEGATGKVVAGTYEGEPVALKVFKGTVSSDGQRNNDIQTLPLQTCPRTQTVPPPRIEPRHISARAHKCSHI